MLRRWLLANKVLIVMSCVVIAQLVASVLL